jgi:flagellar basal body-associated protein FliL
LARQCWGMSAWRLVLICALALGLSVSAHAAEDKAKKPATPEQEQALRITSSPNFLPFFALAVSATPVGRMSGIFSADIGLEIADPALRARAEKNRPRLRAALRDALAEYASVHYRPGRAPDPDQLARLLQAAVDRTLAGPGAKLYLVNVLVQLR